MDYTQDQYRQLLAAQYAADIRALIAQDRFPPPWQNDDFAIQNDEGRLLSAIADNQGLPWHSRIPSICQAVLTALNMQEIGNAKATVARCISLGYIHAKYDAELAVMRLNLTDLGAAMLELWEDESNLRAGDD